MTSSRLPSFLAALGVAGTAGFVGNMLTIGLGFGGYWQSLDPTALMAWFSENFFRFLIPTVMSVLPLSLVGLGASVWLSRGDRPVRNLWAGALGCVAVACIITAVYHLPANLALASQDLSPDEASSTLSMWLLLHWVRVAFAVVATGLSLAAYRRSAGRNAAHA